MLSAVSTSDLNFDLCAQEPIRIPGSIQPHGALVVVDRGSRCSTVLEAPPHIAAATRIEKK
jgi:light-regulated signal transduction histidine kinase (bacteriophytochrome)